MSLKRRLVNAFGASILGPLVTILVQLVNVPVMLRFWGADLYGEWLLISTIPAYLLLTDMGFGNVAGSDMTMRTHAGDREGAIETFQSTTLLVLCISFGLGLLLSAVIFVVPVHRILHLTAMSPRETQMALLFLCINCLVILQWSVIMAAYRCDNNYARGMLYVNAIRITEGVSFLVLLVTRARPVDLAILMLGVSVAGTTLLLIEKRRLIPWMPLGVRHASWQTDPRIGASSVCFYGLSCRQCDQPARYDADGGHHHGAAGGCRVQSNAHTLTDSVSID